MSKTDELRSRAERALVGGVSSGWNYLLDGPTFVGNAAGPYLWDVDGQRYIDFIMGWGSLLLGHDPPALRRALMQALENGFLFAYETPLHVELAQTLCRKIPGVARVRLANSGTEATLHALRIARAWTGRTRVLKFEGHFHGLHDQLLYATDSSPRLGALNPDGSIEPVAGSAGVPEALAHLCVIAPWNDVEAFQRIASAHRHDLAAVILEPIAFNMGCVPPVPEFLETIRTWTEDAGVALIFDEVLTGFRVAFAGSQELYSVTPDLVCFGKALGCGMPIAAVGGRADMMETLAPRGPVEMSGTNTGRVLTVAGTVAALRELSQPGFYAHLNELTDVFVSGMKELLARHNVPAYVTGLGGRIAIYFGMTEAPLNLRAIDAGWNRQFHAAFYARARLKGLYGFLNPLPWSPEAITLSVAHSREVLNSTLSRVDDVLHEVPYRHAD
jgi:glutamate-1-semialdehyde 2,1-aminomutase